MQVPSCQYSTASEPCGGKPSADVTPQASPWHDGGGSGAAQSEIGHLRESIGMRGFRPAWIWHGRVRDVTRQCSDG